MQRAAQERLWVYAGGVLYGGGVGLLELGTKLKPPDTDEYENADEERTGAIGEP